MMTARILAPVHTLGPGKRVVLWTQGCSKHCAGCISPELKERKKEKEIPVEFLEEIICETAKKNHCDGLTISGGDPLEQPEELLKLLKRVRTAFKDVLVYTGFFYEQIENGECGETAKEALGYIDVLIDGPYIQAKNNSEAVLCGSDNQRILYLNPAMEQVYKPYLEEGRKLENFYMGSSFVTVGIPERRFINEANG